MRDRSRRVATLVALACFGWSDASAQEHSDRSREAEAVQPGSAAEPESGASVAESNRAWWRSLSNAERAALVSETVPESGSAPQSDSELESDGDARPGSETESAAVGDSRYLSSITHAPQGPDAERAVSEEREGSEARQDPAEGEDAEESSGSSARSWLPDVFGFATVVVGVDNRNQGSVIDNTLTPNNDLDSEFSITVYPVPTGLGLRLPPQTIRGGWVVEGQVLAAFLFDTQLMLLDSFARVRSRNNEVSFSLGRFTPGILSPLSPSTWNYPFGWGNLQTLFTGIRIEGAVQEFFVDGGVGINAPLANRSAIFDFERGAERFPFVNLRLGYRREPNATRFRNEVGTTIAAWGGYGYERVGTDEDDLVQEIQPGARLPEVEDLQTWVAGVDFTVPITRQLVVTGESYIGKNTHLHTGSMFQTPRIDLDTGRHYALHSMGAWLELSLAVGIADMALIAGAERILGRFEETSLQKRDDVRATMKLAAVVSFAVGKYLSVGFQADYFAAEFEEDELGRTVNLSALIAARLRI